MLINIVCKVCAATLCLASECEVGADKVSFVFIIFHGFYLLFMTPIHKSGKRDDVSNYRGIAILSVMPKLFENILCDQISSSLLSVLHPNQHGFEKEKSFTTNLAEYCSFLLDEISN